MQLMCQKNHGWLRFIYSNKIKYLKPFVFSGKQNELIIDQHLCNKYGIFYKNVIIQEGKREQSILDGKDFG
jgi:hypothetical protein